MSAQKTTASLWPEPPERRRRPLGYREDLTAGQRVYVEATDGAWRFSHWMHCGRERFALLDCGDGDLRVCRAERIRVDA